MNRNTAGAGHTVPAWSSRGGWLRKASCTRALPEPSAPLAGGRAVPTQGQLGGQEAVLQPFPGQKAPLQAN